ncbi:MAG: OmpA family protein [Myxococcales bacterium]|nr:OmpA family protein [Myxococcales bacterium]
MDRPTREWILMKLRYLAAALALSTFGLAPAHAQNVQNFRPAPGTWNGLSVDGARTARHLQFVPSLYLNYGQQPLVYRDANDEVVTTLVEHLGTLNAMGTLGLWDRVGISVDVPVHYVAGDGLEEDGVSLGDVRLIPKVRLFGMAPDDKDSKLGISLVVPVALPTGDSARFVGDDTVTLDPKLVFEMDLGMFRMALNGGVRVRPDEAKRAGLTLSNEVVYGAVAGVHLGSENLELLAEVFGAAPLEEIEGADTAPLEALLGLRIFTRPGPVITVGGGTGIVANYGDPEFRVLLGLAWDPQNRDRDGDGILDDVDQCPDQPEDKDDFEDADGCPDPDNDNDGILDAEDNCPNDPEDKDGFQDADGCPDPDNDNDGILDAQDQCPMDPEDKDDFQDEDGCPDPDNDRDGIKDVDDKCPMDPEDKDGFEDEDGCPDPDNDKDGIPDVKDACPLEPETINGVNDEDGCPDKGKVMVKVTREKIEILEKVFFETNSDVIKTVSFGILNQVAAVLKANAHIKKLRVDGHTDDRGKDDYNLDLSDRRAASVVRYLVAQGVDRARLESKGFGEEQPIDTNKTSKGRANNRRVEFLILEQDAGGTEVRTQ